MELLRIALVFVIAAAGYAAAADAPAPVAAPATARPVLRALRVADDAIKVDGEDGDWQVFGAAFTSATTVAALPANMISVNTDRGTWLGPDDLSIESCVAADATHLYVLARVRDQRLFNDAPLAEMFIGDDVEIFIDANPPAAQFATNRNSNSRQFIFLPAGVNPAKVEGAIWKPDENPGVTMASRLHTWGYTMEVRIPKAAFPYWKEHLELDSVGFDVMVCDADSPGLDGPHGAIKYAGYVGCVGYHFMSSEKLAALRIDRTLADANGDVSRDETTPGEQIVGLIQENDPSAAVGKAVAGADATARKAALLILAKRPTLAAPTKQLIGLCTPNAEGIYSDVDVLSYALVALAERKQLPADEWFGFYNRAPDPQLRLTWVWCCGRNGNPSVVPQLVDLLTDSNLRVRIKAAIALAELNSVAALPALEKMKASDPHHYAQGAAANAIQEIQKRTAPPPAPRNEPK